MARVNESISMYSGEYKKIQDKIVDADSGNIPLDLTDFTAKFIVHNKGNVVIEKTLGDGIEITDAEQGLLEITLFPNDTKDLSGNFSFEVKLDNNVDQGSIVTLGRISITKVYS